MTLKELQEAVQKGWTDELYSAEFRERKCLYKDLDHAIKHVLKAAGKLQNMVEAADHGVADFPANEIGKHIADIVISAARLANVGPGGAVFDLDAEVRLRVDEKILPKERR